MDYQKNLLGQKKGQLFGAFAIFLAIAIVILIAATFFFFSGKMRFILIGIGILVGSFWLLGQGMASNNFSRPKIITVLILFIIGIVFIFAANVVQQQFSGEGNYRLAIPHNGAYSCQAVGTGNPSYSIGSSGIWISSSDIGVYTDQVTNIKLNVPTGYLDAIKSQLGTLGFLIGGTQVSYQICDQNKASCNSYVQPISSSGTTLLNNLPSAINPTKNSVYIVIQSRGTILNSWKNVDVKATLRYAYTKYGLKYVSTTGNPAGALFNGCESSCDLTCPDQKSRSDTGLIYTTKNSLLPTESVPVLEYWEDLNVDLNAQGGATIYDGNQFCFGGAIYSKGTITLDNGGTFVYPLMATRQNVECCNGAVISTSTEDKTCTNNHWVTITKDTRLKCISDFNCPGQGQSTCQGKLLSGWHCGSDGYCDKETTNTPVECCFQADCPTDQTCQSNKCVGGAVTSPVVLINQSNSGGSNQCQWYQDSYTTTQNQCKVLGLFWCNAVPISGCKTSNWVYLVIVAGVIFLIIIVLILTAPKKRGKRR